MKLLHGALISLLLSWGKNFPILTDVFIDYFPFYNKFRAVSSIQIILEFCFPVLAAIGVYTIAKEKKEFWKSIFKISLIVLLYKGGVNKSDSVGVVKSLS